MHKYRNILKNLKSWKIKIIILMVIEILYYIKYYILLKDFKPIVSPTINELKTFLEKYSNLEIYNSSDDKSAGKREEIFNVFMKKNINDKIKNVNSIYIDVNFRFGNLISFFTKVINFCEIIHCKKIILNEEKFWFIDKSINLTYKNISFKIGNNSDYKSSCFLYNKPWAFYFDFFNVKPEIKIHNFRNAILHNLPKMNTSKNELFIHVRSGNIFNSYIHHLYSQPPLCFYKRVLINFNELLLNFTNIYLIAQDNNNPVINELIKKYPSIKNTRSSMKEDIALLINAYNIVCSISSFLSSILQLNYNFEYLWDYNIYRNEEKIRHFHYDFNELPHNNFTIFRMEPSKKYKEKMYEWKSSRSQLKLMLKDKCINDFTLIKKY